MAIVAVESLYQKGNDHCITPEWVKQGLFQGWFDPCPLSVWGGTKHQMDGLKVEWENKTFVNPPYSNPLPWIEKAIQENKQGKTIALLVKHDSSTKWFRLLHEANAHFLMFQGRLHFNNCKTAAPFASVLAVLYVKEAH